MNPETWQRLKTIVADALEEDSPAARAAIVANQCADDAALLRVAESLLREADTILLDSDDALEDCARTVTDLIDRTRVARTGQRMGAYEIGRELGHGGMGNVYLGRRADGQFEREVAIKVLKRGTDTDDVLRRFEAERRIVASLDHPGIARLWDSGTTTDGLPYFVMEYVAGVPISRFVRDRSLTLPQRLELFFKVCAAVDFAHRRSILHRDLKANNILVTEDGEPKLLDFGIAKLMNEVASTEQTAAGEERFTPNCASPEQAAGEKLTEASDIYALGALLFELLTGKPAHCFSSARPSIAEVNRVLREEQPTLPSEAMDDPERQRLLRGNLDRIVSHALQFDPSARYPTVTALADDIRKFLDEQPIKAPRAKRKVGLRVSAIAGVVLTGLGTMLFMMGDHSSFPARAPASTAFASIHSLAVLPFEPLGSDRGNEILGLGMADAIIGRLSGVKLVVLPTAAVSRFQGPGNDPISAGENLQVDAIVCGTVQRSGKDVRVTVQLIKVATRQILWATTFDRIFTGIFGIQDSISGDVARFIATSLSPSDQMRLVKHDTGNTAAYEFYLLGLSSYSERTKDGMARAAEYFEKAVEQDPNYALAYALMADTYFLQGYYEYEPAAESVAKARVAAERSIAIDSSLAEGYMVLGSLQDRARADQRPHSGPTGSQEDLLRHALDLEPNLAIAHQRYAWRLCAIGDLDQSLKEMQRAQQLDPLSSTNNTALGLVHLFARQFELGLHYSERASEINPDEPFIQANLGSAYLLNHQYAAAIARFEKSTTLNPNLRPDNLALIALTLWSAGQGEEANQVLSEVLKLAADKRVDPYNLAITYAARGETDLAFEWLARYFDRGHPVPGYIRYDILLDPLRSDRRFEEMLRHYDRSDLLPQKDI